LNFLIEVDELTLELALALLDSSLAKGEALLVAESIIAEFAPLESSLGSLSVSSSIRGNELMRKEPAAGLLIGEEFPLLFLVDDPVIPFKKWNPSSLALIVALDGILISQDRLFFFSPLLS
jgi:hypothetical protein